MNKKVLKTMIALVVIFLVALYVLKIFFPEQFVLSVENETIILIGNYIDTNKWASIIYGIVVGCIFDYFYFGAVCRQKLLNWKLIVTILVYNIGFALYYNLAGIEIITKYSNIIVAISSCYMILLPMFFTKTIKELSITYSINSIAQLLSLSIRDISILMTNANSIINTLISIECYFWIILLFLYFNFKGGKKWDTANHSMETNKELKQKSQQLIEKSNLFKRIGQSIKNNLTKSKIKKKLRKIKLAIKDFIIDELWQYLIIFASIALCAWIFNKWIEAIMFCIAHTCIRNAFNKQFHFNITAYCLSLTMAIIWFSIPITLPLTTSLLSSIPVAFLICFVGFIAQDRVDLYGDIQKLNLYVSELLSKVNHKDIYAMSEDELYKHCRNCGLGEEDCKIAYFVVIERLKGKELYKAINYSERQTKRKRKDILDKIK